MRYTVLAVLLAALALSACNGGGEQVQPTETPSPGIARPSPTPEPPGRDSEVTPTTAPTALPGEPTPAATPEPKDRIAFVADGDVFVINADGSGEVNLSGGLGGSLPAWSPDGTRIAFYSASGDCDPEDTGLPADEPTCPDAWTLYVVNADGTGLTDLASLTPIDTPIPPAWSPDGGRIAIEIGDGGPGGGIGIHVVNADGSGSTNLTNNPAGDAGPSWSPDGTKIAFTSNRDGSPEIYVMAADGSGLTRLTNNTAVDAAPSWSPDGSLIAFVSDRDGNLEVYVMNTDGSGQVNLTNSPENEFSSPVGHFPLAWSPDGSRIAFMSDRDGDIEIYAVSADGSGQVNLTNTPQANETFPAWSPDGTRLAFESCSRDGCGTFIITLTDQTGPISPMTVAFP